MAKGCETTVIESVPGNPSAFRVKIQEVDTEIEL